MNQNSTDELTEIADEIKSEIQSLHGIAEEIWNSNRRLDNAICGPGGVIPTIASLESQLKRIYYVMLGIFVMTH